MELTTEQKIAINTFIYNYFKSKKFNSFNGQVISIKYVEDELTILMKSNVFYVRFLKDFARELYVGGFTILGGWETIKIYSFENKIIELKMIIQEDI